MTNSADLAREEERISKKKALELFDSGLLDQLEAGKYSALKACLLYTSDGQMLFRFKIPPDFSVNHHMVALKGAFLKAWFLSLLHI